MPRKPYGEEDYNVPATGSSARTNAGMIWGRDEVPPGTTLQQAIDITRRLRGELAAKGLKGFKKGGKVKKTGVYKLHKGEKVVTAKAAQKQHATARKAPARKAAARRR